MGIIFVVVLMLLSNVPRLMRNFGKQKPNKPAPVEVQPENLQALEEALKKIEERPVRDGADELGEVEEGEDQPDRPQDERLPPRPADAPGQFRS